jgi:hypothetical protein
VLHQLERRRTLREMVLGTAHSIAGTVYGTIVVMGLITAGAEQADAWRLATVVAVTVVVLWLAHVYAHALGEAIGRGRRLDREELVSVARRELAIPLAAFAPIAALVLGALGLFEDSTALWVALGIGLATLAVQGLRYAQLEHFGRGGIVKSVALNVALGLFIVALKVALAH